MDKTNYLENYFNYPINFPVEEFNQELEKILENKPLEIREKKLQDFIYDSLEKKGVLTGIYVFRIFNIWPETIEKIMFLKRHVRSRINPEIYVPIDSS